MCSFPTCAPSSTRWQGNDGLKNKFDLVTKERASLVEKVTSLADEKKALEEEVVKLKESGGRP